MRLHSRPRRSYDTDVLYECDVRAALHILAFLARHQPRGNDLVVRKVRRQLPDICGLLGAGQGIEEEVGDFYQYHRWENGNSCGHVRVRLY
jgi:hypothetical protein